MAFAQTKHYWFAFHIGDGKCIAFQPDSIWFEPIPWDERCFLNKTTSICDSEAINEFRYCYQGDGNFPTIVFLGSDGVDDSFGETANMVNFYIQFSKEIVNSEKQALSSIESTLPELSRIGSKDDMSVACVYNRNKLKEFMPVLLDWQIKQVQTDINDADERIAILTDRIDHFSDTITQDNRIKIELQYAQSDLMKAHDQKENLIRKINKLLQEKEGDCFIPYFEGDSKTANPCSDNASPMEEPDNLDGPNLINQ